MREVFGLPGALPAYPGKRDTAALQLGIVRKIDARMMLLVQNATCSVSAKKLSTQRSKNQSADAPNGDLLFGNELGGVQNIEFKRIGEFVVEALEPVVMSSFRDKSLLEEE